MGNICGDHKYDRVIEDSIPKLEARQKVAMNGLRAAVKTRQLCEKAYEDYLNEVQDKGLEEDEGEITTHSLLLLSRQEEEIYAQCRYDEATRDLRAMRTSRHVVNSDQTVTDEVLEGIAADAPRLERVAEKREMRLQRVENLGSGSERDRDPEVHSVAQSMRERVAAKRLRKGLAGVPAPPQRAHPRAPLNEHADLLQHDRRNDAGEQN